MNTVILSCESLEVYVAAAQKTAGTTYPVIWLKQKYHEEPAVMRSHILETIASLPKEVDTVLVAMGFCGGSWDAVTADRRIVLPPKLKADGAYVHAGRRPRQILSRVDVPASQ